MEAKDIMSSPVIAVAPDAPLSEAVERLLEHRISGVLVVEEGRVVGVLGAGDLLHRHEIGTDNWRGYQHWWQRLTTSRPGPRAYVKSHGAHVRDVMNPEVVSVQENAPLTALASLFEKRHIRRVPVLRGEELLGVVTRADMVRALAANRQAQVGPPWTGTDDAAIRERLIHELSGQSWWSGAWASVAVENGVVTYGGVVRSLADKRAARVAAENIPGVRAVEDRRVLEEDFQPMV